MRRVQCTVCIQSKQQIRIISFDIRLDTTFEILKLLKMINEK